MRELADQTARRVRQHRQALGEIGARGEFGMRDEAGQDAVEQLDVIGAKARRPLQEKFADAARGVGAALRGRHDGRYRQVPGSAMVQLS